VTPRVVACSGKGGVGKTTIASLLVRYLMQYLKEGPILAVDADPNSNLNELLGEPVTSTIGDARELMKDSVPAGMSKDAWLEMKVHQAIIETRGFDLLVMGRPEGSGCYCAANSLVKKHIDLLKTNYAWVVADNEAGMEHMSRLVTQDIDYLFVVSDPTARGLLTARRILDLIGELRLNILNTRVVANRVQEGNEEGVLSMAQSRGVELSGVIHEDPAVGAMDREGGNIFLLDESSVAVRDTYTILDRTFTPEANRQGQGR
jgi:CO dehydrogenase maturation factor